MMMAIRRMKNTVNFLKAMKAASGNTVTQYDDKMLVVHMIIEYGMINFIASLLNLVFQTVINSKIFISRCIMNAYIMLTITNE